MVPQDPPPAPQTTPSTQHTPDRLSAVLGNATLLGIGYMLLRRPRLAILSLIGSISLLALIALYPHVLVWRLLLPVWWAVLVLHAWWAANRERLVLRGEGSPVWRKRVLAAACLLLVTFAWLRFDTWTIVRDAEAAHAAGDCDRAMASSRWLGSPHDLAYGALASRGQQERKACEWLLDALAEPDPVEEARVLHGYMDRPGALWDGAGPKRAELLLEEVISGGDMGVVGDEELTEGEDPTAATVEEAFAQLSATLQDTPGQSERVRAVAESFLADLAEVPPCDAVTIDGWLREQTWQEPELAEPVASEADQLPIRAFDCADSFDVNESDSAGAAYQGFLAQYPEHDLAARAVDGLFAYDVYCEYPAAYSGAPAYEGAGPHAMEMMGINPNGYGFPDSWQADTVDEAVLVVCVEGPDRGSHQASCYYGPTTDQSAPYTLVDFYASKFTVKAYELRTGELVEDYSEEIGDPCPDVIEYISSFYDFDSVPSEYDSDYSDADVQSVFDRLMD